MAPQDKCPEHKEVVEGKAQEKKKATEKKALEKEKLVEVILNDDKKKSKDEVEGDNKVDKSYNKIKLISQFSIHYNTQREHVWLDGKEKDESYNSHKEPYSYQQFFDQLATDRGKIGALDVFVENSDQQFFDQLATDMGKIGALYLCSENSDQRFFDQLATDRGKIGALTVFDENFSHIAVSDKLNETIAIADQLSVVFVYRHGSITVIGVGSHAYVQSPPLVPGGKDSINVKGLYTSHSQHRPTVLVSRPGMFDIARHERRKKRTRNVFKRVSQPADVPKNYSDEEADTCPPKNLIFNQQQKDANSFQYSSVNSSMIVPGMDTVDPLVMMRNHGASQCLSGSQAAGLAESLRISYPATKSSAAQDSSIKYWGATIHSHKWGGDDEIDRNIPDRFGLKLEKKEQDIEDFDNNSIDKNAQKLADIKWKKGGMGFAGEAWGNGLQGLCHPQHQGDSLQPAMKLDAAFVGLCASAASTTSQPSDSDQTGSEESEQDLFSSLSGDSHRTDSVDRLDFQESLAAEMHSGSLSQGDEKEYDDFYYSSREEEQSEDIGRRQFGRNRTISTDRVGTASSMGTVDNMTAEGDTAGSVRTAGNMVAAKDDTASSVRTAGNMETTEDDTAGSVGTADNMATAEDDTAGSVGTADCPDVADKVAAGRVVTADDLETAVHLDTVDMVKTADVGRVASADTAGNMGHVTSIENPLFLDRGQATSNPAPLAPDTGPDTPDAGHATTVSRHATLCPGSVPPESDPVTSYLVPVTPHSSPVAPHPGPIIPSTDPIMPDPGPIPPDSGPVTPDPSQKMASTGPIIPDPGPVTMSTDPITPDRGPLSPDPGSVTPSAGPVASNAGPVSPGPSTHAPNSLSLMCTGETNNGGVCTQDTTHGFFSSKEETNKKIITSNDAPLYRGAASERGAVSSERFYDESATPPLHTPIQVSSPGDSGYQFPQYDHHPVSDSQSFSMPMAAGQGASAQTSPRTAVFLDSRCGASISLRQMDAHGHGLHLHTSPPALDSHQRLFTGLQLHTASVQSVECALHQSVRVQREESTSLDSSNQGTSFIQNTGHLQTAPPVSSFHQHVVVQDVVQLPPPSVEMPVSLNVSQASHLEFASLAARRDTYGVNWPTECGVDADTMAKAGFFWTRGRHVRCFYCGLEILVSGQNVWEDHILHSPHCRYLAFCMGLHPP